LLTASAWGQTPDPQFATLEARCTRVLDGDTLVLRGGERVRLLGIDTPEIGQPYANEAKMFTLSLVAHRTLRLEFDEAQRDSYDRLLAHVYVETDEGWKLVNLELIRAGLAKLLFIPPNDRYHALFEETEREAQIERRGMWGAVPGALSIEDLEERLVECVTEVVTVVFTVVDVSAASQEWRLDAEGSEFGFHVLVPSDSDAAIALAPLEDLAGSIVSVTGTLDCDVRHGPWITVTSPAQVQILDASEGDATDSP
jgi:micrococcal nuclease